MVHSPYRPAENGKFVLGHQPHRLEQHHCGRGYALPFWADGRSNDGNIEVFSALAPLAGEQTTSIPRLQSLTDRFSLIAYF